MNFENVYVLADALIPDAVVAKSVEKIDGRAIFHGRHVPESILKFTVALGSRFTDMLGTGWACLYLVSKRFISAMERADATGWRALPAEVIDRNGQFTSDYSLFSVFGRCGAIDESKSNVVSLPSRSRKGTSLFQVGLYFEPDSWDGHDVFSPAPQLYTFVTERVKDELQNARLENVSLRKITEVQRLMPRHLMTLYEEGRLSGSDPNERSGGGDDSGVKNEHRKG